MQQIRWKEKLVLRFEDWLIGQQHRKDLIGALARVPSMQHVPRKTSRRNRDEHKNWAEVVTELRDPSYIAVFNKAWQEFQLAKQAAKEATN